MQIYLTNTLSKKKEVFEPLTSGNVGMYHCGPTVYWVQHIGNMRAVTIADFFNRMFTYNDYKVNLTRNYTDVGHLTGDTVGAADTGEDRMTKAVQRENLDPNTIAEKYIAIYKNDTSLLNILPATHDPKATDYIHEMQELVSELIKNGNAYTTDDAVYFDVTTYSDYTQLSGQHLAAQVEGEGHGTITDSNKRNPADFALWFFKTGPHANALQTWPSPFHSPVIENGEGFPGWHIECSAMSKVFLGSTFDVHMGGIEHIPIHHTNEIAQSTCANHAHFVNYWLHNEHLLVDNKKMSKSEGTSFTLADIIEKGYEPLTLRYFYLQAHYRSKQNFMWEALEASQTALRKLKKIIAQLPDGGVISESYQVLFHEMINDDLNTAGALAVVWELLKNQEISDADKKATLLNFDTVLGLQLDIPFESATIEVPAHVQLLMDERTQARARKDWAKSDELRDQINALGFKVQDK